MSKTSVLVSTGIIIGIIALILATSGNPPNMGVCVACFLRDTAGGFKLHTAAPVQYMRPEIFGFALGAFISALIFKTFQPRAGSAPMIRFLLGFLMMVGCLVFLGCPLRVILRLGAGDFNAILGLAGLCFGIGLGVFFLRRNFSLPANQPQHKLEGAIFPFVCIILLGLTLFLPHIFAASSSGPGSMHAPVLYALAGGLLIGGLVERTRFCSIGFISHIFLFKRFSMFLGMLAFFLTILAGNLYFGTFRSGFSMQPIAHQDSLWNFLSMALVGICGVFLGGCPLRQIVKAGTADGDGAVTVIGMLTGAAFAHNFAIASVAQNQSIEGGATITGKIVIVSALLFVLLIGMIYSSKVQKTVS